MLDLLKENAIIFLSSYVNLYNNNGGLIMGRMSARFVAKKVGKSTSWVYEMWKDMGLISKNGFGEWDLTELGKKIGGKMSSGYHVSVPTFDFDKIEQMMIDYYNQFRK